ncbi:leucine zipper putative tumor suppressor 1 isoform X2 [Kryptolebias marmoratus]|uniref:leucine zipper putative tumor suppressor 1 isoform X2 n=1 Tax=Kryptolebias marmoratus TaxID=37003 RepID=UPI0007F8F148|nr:leucine zipper putative tumor suppressor 1 isoform X2 [Kryptolebias marmoratus]
MGSVSSLINGNSLNSKHCRASEHRLKEGASHHRKSGGCSLDGLLKCGFAQGSSSSTHHSKGLSHSRSGRSEDFFYIKVSNKPKSGYHREPLEETVTRDGKSDGRQQPKPKLLLMPGKISERGSLTSAEKSLVHSTAFKSANPSRPSSTEIGHNSLDHILCPLRKARSPNVGHKQDTLGTLSDSGRNSMSSLPTHSTSGSLRASTGPVCQSDGSSALANSLSRGQQPNFPPWVNGNNANPDCSYKGCWNSSVLASKTNEDSGSPLSADEPRTASETTGGIRSPITTDESLIEHLEQRLLERETEQQELQVSLEEKEADTCQLFEERQRYCAEKMDGLKQHCSTKLQLVSQMAAKTHQALQLQVIQLQTENDKLQEDVSKLTQERNLVELRLRSYEKVSTQIVPTLEETQWEVCQKTGEISLLKQQLRECQADVSHKLNEIVSLKASLKENMAKVEKLEQQNKDYEEKLRSCTREAEVCQNELQRKKNEADFLREKVSKLEKDIQGKNQDFTTAKDKRLQQSLELEGRSPTRTSEGPVQESESSEQEADTMKHVSTESLQRQVERLKQQLGEEKSAQQRLVSSFEQERQTWNKEKDKVIKYQKQLQINYLQVHKKNRDLEKVLKEQTAELESRAELGKNIRYASGLQTYDDVIATEI